MSLSTASHRISGHSKLRGRWRPGTRLARLSVAIAIAGIVSVGAPRNTNAQKRSDVGIGVEVGTETGVTLKLFPDRKFAYEFLAAWNIGDWFFLNGHMVYSKALEEEPRVRAAYGLGAYIGVYDSNRNDNVFAGVSARGAIVYAFDQFELYVHLTPRMNLIPGTNFDLGGGLGFRVFV